MKVKSVAVALFAVLGVAAQAYATTTRTINLGTLVVGDNYLSGSETTSVVVSAGSFEDIYSFHLSAISGLEGSAAVVNFGKFTIADTSFYYDLFAAGNATSLANGVNTTGFTLGGLGSGDYQLKVVGTAGSKGGQYAGVLTVSAVPEPESYAMFLAGLGLMAAVARRRSK